MKKDAKKIGLYMLLASVSYPALAQAEQSTDSNNKIEVIQVTAQRRSENIQNVPITISTVSALKLETSGIKGTTDLALVTPGLSLPSNVGRVIPRIRGVGTTVNGPGLENSVGIYIDNIYIANSVASTFSLSNIKRVEVLKGPQGTLFGRNATGGVVSVITKDPSHEFQGDYSLGYGNYNTFSASGYITGGLSENVAADLSVYYSTQGDGYGTNLNTGNDINETSLDFAIRTKWLFNFGENTTLTLSADDNILHTSFGLGINSLNCALSSLGPALCGSDVQNASLTIDPKLETESWGVSAQLEHDFGFATFKSISGYRYSSYNRVFDLDGIASSNVKSLFISDSKQFSQEFHLASNGSGRLKWLVGAFYFNMDDSLDPNKTDFDPLGNAYSASNKRVQTRLYTTLNTNAWAGFAQGSYDFTDRTSLTLGVRYSYEKRDIQSHRDGTLIDSTIVVVDAPIDRETDFDRTTWRISLDHKLTDDIMVYASFNTGFKSGGFNSGGPNDPPFNPEYLNAYEIGLKSEFNDNLRLNASIFYYDYQNLQVSQRVAGLTTVYNGAASEIYGLDLDFDWHVTDKFSLNGGIEILNHEFTEFPAALTYIPNLCTGTSTLTLANGYIYCLNTSGKYVGGNTQSAVNAKGNKLPYTSDFTASLTANYDFTDDLSLSMTYAYNSGFYPDPDNLRKQDAYSLLNASLLWKLPNDKYSLRLWGKNLTDAEVVNNFAATRELDQGTYMAPLTYGITFKAEF